MRPAPEFDVQDSPATDPRRRPLAGIAVDAVDVGDLAQGLEVRLLFGLALEEFFRGRGEDDADRDVGVSGEGFCDEGGV